MKKGNKMTTKKAKKSKKSEFNSDLFTDEGICPFGDCGSSDFVEGPIKERDEKHVVRRIVCNTCGNIFEAVYALDHVVNAPVDTGDGNDEDEEEVLDGFTAEGGLDEDEFKEFFPGAEE